MVKGWPRYAVPRRSSLGASHPPVATAPTSPPTAITRQIHRPDLPADRIATSVTGHSAATSAPLRCRSCQEMPSERRASVLSSASPSCRSLRLPRDRSGRGRGRPAPPTAPDMRAMHPAVHQASRSRRHPAVSGALPNRVYRSRGEGFWNMAGKRPARRRLRSAEAMIGRLALALAVAIA
jgi:hypothetical protein